MRSGIIVALALLLIIAAGCTGNVVKDDTIRVGAVLPMTGEAADFGTYASRGIAIAVEEINAGGGVNGRPLEAVIEDDAMDPRLAVTAYRKLAEQDKARYIVGFGSGETLAVCPLTGETGTVLMSSGSSDAISACAHTYRNFAPNSFQAAEMAQRAKSAGLDRATILYENTDYGNNLRQRLRAEFKGDIVAEESYEDGASDVRTQIMKIKAAKPQVLFLLGKLKEGPIVLRQIKELDIAVPIIATDGLKDDGLLEKVDTSGLNLSVVYVASYRGEEAQRFAAAYKQKHGEEPGIFADYLHDSVLALARAMQGCAETDTACVERNLVRLNITGATGTIDYDENGDVLGKPYTIYGAEGRRFVEVN